MYFPLIFTSFSHYFLDSNIFLRTYIFNYISCKIAFRHLKLFNAHTYLALIHINVKHLRRCCKNFFVLYIKQIFHLRCYFKENKLVGNIFCIDKSWLAIYQSAKNTIYFISFSAIFAPSTKKALLGGFRNIFGIII